MTVPSFKMNRIDLTDQEIDDVLLRFYESFETGYDFERFLKIYLEAIGLDEIEVTQQSSDGGLDLKCLKRGIDELTDLDSVKYYVQAKRFKPDNIVSLESVRALRGIMPDGFKGIFITTGKFSKNAYEFGADSESRALILIDGKTLVASCIDKGLGFRVKPIFVPTDLRKLMEMEESAEPKEVGEQTEIDGLRHLIKKKITENDIRARILRIPKTIIEKIPEQATSFGVKFENENVAELKLDKTRTYFAGVTSVYRKFGLLDDDETKNSKDAFWSINDEKGIIEVKFER